MAHQISLAILVALLAVVAVLATNSNVKVNQNVKNVKKPNITNKPGNVLRHGQVKRVNINMGRSSENYDDADSDVVYDRDNQSNDQVNQNVQDNQNNRVNQIPSTLPPPIIPAPIYRHQYHLTVTGHAIGNLLLSCSPYRNASSQFPSFPPYHTKVPVVSTLFTGTADQQIVRLNLSQIVPSIIKTDVLRQNVNQSHDVIQQKVLQAYKVKFISAARG